MYFEHDPRNDEPDVDCECDETPCICGQMDYDDYDLPKAYAVPVICNKEVKWDSRR